VPGLQRARRGGPGGLVRTDDQRLGDLIAFKVKSGRWPTHKEGMVGTGDHASSRTYARRFGSWSGGPQAGRATRTLEIVIPL
jgi:hypothetical protein